MRSIQVGVERPAEMVPRDSREVLMSRLQAVVLSEGCPGWRYLRTGQGVNKRTVKHAGRDSMAATRLAAADERISRTLADAVERHAAKDPGVRCVLKRASATCHPESESQKKIALDTEQESTARPAVSHGGSSASGT